MKKTSIILFFAAVVLVAVLGGCTDPSADAPTTQPETVVDAAAQLDASLQEYWKMVDGELPKDLRLKIYWISPSIATRRPLSVEDLISIDGVYKIDVSAEDLAENQETLKELTPAVLHSAEGDYYLGARVYYVFEAGENNKILEVAMWCHNENISGDYGVLVNGVTVEETPAFFRLIEPFLTEEARDMLKDEMGG